MGAKEKIRRTVEGSPSIPDRRRSTRNAHDQRELASQRRKIVAVRWVDPRDIGSSAVGNVVVDFAQNSDGIRIRRSHHRRWSLGRIAPSDVFDRDEGRRKGERIEIGKTDSGYVD